MRSVVTLPVLLLMASARAQRPPTPDALPNDNTVPAGRLASGELRIALDARVALWHPEGNAGPGIPLYTFAERGKSSTVPGPLLRVPVGTDVAVTVHNTLPERVWLKGFQDRGTSQFDSIIVEPESTANIRFRASTPGTYFYSGATTTIQNGPPGPQYIGTTKDAELLGAFIVDSANARQPAHDRIFVITRWTDTLSVLGARSSRSERVMASEFRTATPETWFVFAINGLSWPHTERLSYTVGDTVNWRVINASFTPHPMHLHGFFFDVLARGAPTHDSIYTPDRRRKAVTEPLGLSHTMAMRFVAETPGNWLFHCHMVTHIDRASRLDSSSAPPMEMGHHAETAMAGLVLGFRVAPARGVTSLAGNPAAPARRLRVFIDERPGTTGSVNSSYVLQEGPDEPRRDSIAVPSSTLILRRGEPTQITVINHTSAPTTVHWHGVELESYYDGVGDWSGSNDRMAAPIAPNDSFVVRLTPRRAGTFIYHTHTDEATGLPSGLFGTVVVLPDASERDTTERIVLLGGGIATSTVNGTDSPRPIELRAGTAYRFRFVNITSDTPRRIRLIADSVVQTWRAVAKDGWELPANQATIRPANVQLWPGETYDFEIKRDAPGRLTLETTSRPIRPVPVQVIVK
jgi:FtsP/CotA-like multicopper oxidase with cupredoxin domain